MNRTMLYIVALAWFVTFLNPAQGQQITVTKKPAPQAGPDEFVVYDTWTVEVYLRGDAKPSVEWGTYPTQAEAVAVAQQGLAKNHAINPPTAFTYADKVAVVGAASVRSKKGPSLPDADRIQKGALTTLREDTEKYLDDLIKTAVDDAFTKKNNDIKDAYDRAKKGKEFLHKNVGVIIEDDFTKVNGLIKDYNGKADRYAGEKPNGEYFAALPRMTPVNADDVRRQAGKWGSAAESQDRLVKERLALEKERERLESERRDLIKEGNNTDAEKEAIGSLRNGLEKGPYSARVFGDIVIDDKVKFPGIVIQKFNTYQDAYDYLKDLGYPPPKYAAISDRDGATVKEAPSGDEDGKIESREKALQKRRAHRGEGVDAYKADMEAYNQSLRQYEQHLTAHKAVLAELSEDAYQPPKGREKGR